MAIHITPLVNAATKILPAVPWEKFNRKKPIPLNQQYEHFKGGVYTVLVEQVHHEATGELMTVYQGIDGTVWVRPSSEFHGYVNTFRRFMPIIPEKE